MKSKSYVKFAAMMAVSFVIMYAVMFLNADLFEHVMLSTTRTYMTILMVAPMAISMMLFMWGMYENKKANYLIPRLRAGHLHRHTDYAKKSDFDRRCAMDESNDPTSLFSNHGKPKSSSPRSRGSETGARYHRGSKAGNSPDAGYDQKTEG